MCVCLCVCCTHECSCHRLEEGVDFSGLELQTVINCSAWVLGTKPDSLQEQAVLVTTEPTLQPHFYRLILGDRALWISSPPHGTSIFMCLLPVPAQEILHSLWALHSVPSAAVSAAQCAVNSCMCHAVCCEHLWACMVCRQHVWACTVCRQHLWTLDSVLWASVSLHRVLLAAFSVHLLHSE